MKLWYSPVSPFVRKVLVTARESGQADMLELQMTTTNVVDSDSDLRAVNPLGKIPALELENGQALFDSRVICAYLATLDPDRTLALADETGRFRSMTLEALSDGIMDAAVSARYESALRPESFRWEAWYDGQTRKIETGLECLESEWIDMLEGPLNIGVIAAGCAVGYLGIRFGERNWLESRPMVAEWFKKFGERQSMKETEPAM